MEEAINEKDSILLIDYIFDKEKPYIDKILIENKEYLFLEMNNKKIKINFNEYEKEFGSKILSLTILNQNIERIHYFEVISGINVGILFPSFGLTRDIIFPDDKEYKVKIISSSSKKEFSIKERLLLINFNSAYELFINDKLITTQILNSGYSSQISLFDLEKQIFFYKSISPLQFDLFFDAYENYNNDAKYFYDSIYEFLNKNKFNFVQYKKLFYNEELIKTIMYKFNLPKNILKNKYNKKEYFEFISSCALYFIMCSLNDEKEIFSTYKYFIEFKTKLEKDSNLEYYQRNIIIIELANMLKKKNNRENFEKLDFKYYNTKTLEKDSLLESTLTFLVRFIDNLDNKSPFIYPLILIDSGNYIYGNEDAYGYGLTNLDILKSHLYDAIPDIIITVNDGEIKSEETLLNKLSVSVKLNLSTKLLIPFQNYLIDKKIENKNIGSNLELILFLTLFYKIFGHKKRVFSSKDKDFYNSPNIF